MVSSEDVSFNIPVRIGSWDRGSNLRKVVAYLSAHFNAQIIIVEEGGNEVPHLLSGFEDHYDYYQLPGREDRLIQKTKMLNLAASRSPSPILISHDADILIPVSQMVEAIEKIRSRKADMVFPFNGDCIDLPKYITQNITDPSKANKLQPSLGVLRTHDQCVGGCLVMDKQKFNEAGMENERFYGWGGEDNERYSRFKRLGYKIERTKGALYHLFHSRSPGSRKQHAHYVENFAELVRISQMNQNQLRKEVQGWEWCHSYK